MRAEGLEPEGRPQASGGLAGGPACGREAQTTLPGTQRATAGKATAGTFQNDEMIAQRESRLYKGGQIQGPCAPLQLGLPPSCAPGGLFPVRARVHPRKAAL